MIANTLTPSPTQMIVTLEDNAMVADIRTALKMIRDSLGHLATSQSLNRARATGLASIFFLMPR